MTGPNPKQGERKQIMNRSEIKLVAALHNIKVGRGVLTIALFCAMTASAVEVPEKLLNAISIVESGKKANAVGDNGKALGCFQLHKIHVRDVNNILGRSVYSYSDRLNPNKSKAVTVIYLKHYGRVYERKTGKPATLEVLARIHNGGPNGWSKPATKEYWLKVKKALGQ